jgi:hypothetical protein
MIVVGFACRKPGRVPAIDACAALRAAAVMPPCPPPPRSRHTGTTPAACSPPKPLPEDCPPHIAMRIVGHHSLNTIQTYLAVFQGELVRTHRAFTDQRCATRPTSRVPRAHRRKPSNIDGAGRGPRAAGRRPQAAEEKTAAWSPLNHSRLMQVRLYPGAHHRSTKSQRDWSTPEGRSDVLWAQICPVVAVGLDLLRSDEVGTGRDYQVDDFDRCRSDVRSTRGHLDEAGSSALVPQSWSGCGSELGLLGWARRDGADRRVGGCSRSPRKNMAYTVCDAGNTRSLFSKSPSALSAAPAIGKFT